MSQSLTQIYIDNLQKKFATGVALEHAYRPALQNYLEALLKDTQAVNDPKRQACGAPDYIVSKMRKGESIDVGYIEAKDITQSLDKTEKTDQMKRYLASLDNLILTDYMEFRFFKMGQKIATVRIAELDNFFTQTPKIKAFPDKFNELETLLQDFVEFKGQTIKSANSLAEKMALKAQLMRDVFQRVLEDEAESTLKEQLAAFQDILIHDLSIEQFSDVYAQTICYGLFTARLHDVSLEDFTRKEARDLIPRSNPFLRRLFDYVCGVDLDERVVWIVDALCEVYRAADVKAILNNFGKQTGRNDPIIHFYETFLGAYDPKLRKARGVWYTPEPVVNFIVRAIDDVLITHFNLADGIASNEKITIETDAHDKGKAIKVKQSIHKVQLLDVAAGTGTFTAEAIKQIHAKMQGMGGMWSSYIEEHLLPRLHGFEILMASYAMCHLKIDLLLQELNYKPKNPNNPPRLGVYLTNALEEYHEDTGTLFASWLAKEANEANRIKRDLPIMVAYGNPPYSVSSQNKGKWIQELIAPYKKDLNEKNINPLSDDYIKFIRLAEHHINRTGAGVVGMITNNSFLDGLIHRQMRKTLLESFDEIYILDLHGSAKKQEKQENGKADKNVFDIMQGVSISIMVKTGKKKAGTFANIRHLDLYGSREEKYETLWNLNIGDKAFEALESKEPHYFFVKKDFGEVEQYNTFFSLNDLFPINASGVKTERDDLVIQFDEQKLNEIKKAILTLPENEFRQKYSNKPDGRDWTIKNAKEDLQKNINIQPRKIAYRPFDNRFTIFTGKTKGIHAYPRNEMMQNFIDKNNICLSFMRQAVFENDYSFVLISKSMIDNRYFYSNRGIALFAPLYLYPQTPRLNDTIDAFETQKRKANLDAKIVKEIAKALSLPFIADHDDKQEGDTSAFTPLDVLDYIYAVLHSPKYRETYKEFLKIDFPRVPYPNPESFWQLVEKGKALRQLHLLEGEAFKSL